MKGLSPVLVALAAAGMMPASGANAQTIALFTKNNTNPFSQAIRIGSNAAAVANRPNAMTAERLLAVRPTTSVQSWLSTQFRQDKTLLRAEADALRSAGIPER